jgi:hypothetical protein
MQDEPLDWGCAVDRKPEDLTRLRTAGHTLRGAATDDEADNDFNNDKER